MACVLLSLASGIPIRKDVAMTGELTLRGRVLPIGGLKEKILAAVRAGMRLALVPAGNLAELGEVPEHLRQRIKLQAVHTMDEVLGFALTKPIQPVRSQTVNPAVATRRGSPRVITHPRRGGAA
jgi:ATP-dependent Lon protease